jgi:hypothetical protein
MQTVGSILGSSLAQQIAFNYLSRQTAKAVEVTIVSGTLSIQLMCACSLVSALTLAKAGSLYAMLVLLAMVALAGYMEILNTCDWPSLSTGCSCTQALHLSALHPLAARNPWLPIGAPGAEFIGASGAKDCTHGYPSPQVDASGSSPGGPHRPALCQYRLDWILSTGHSAGSPVWRGHGTAILGILCPSPSCPGLMFISYLCSGNFFVGTSRTCPVFLSELLRVYYVVYYVGPDSFM